MGNILDPARAERISAIAAIAVKLESELGYPADALVAQWAIETGWGAKPCCGTNYFGMKYVAARHSAFCLIPTHEYMTPAQFEQWNAAHPPEEHATIVSTSSAGTLYVSLPARFAKYASQEDSCRDYIWLIQNGAPYRSAWQQFLKDRSSSDLIRSLSKSYSTTPGYGESVLKVASGLVVQQAIEEAKKPKTNP